LYGFADFCIRPIIYCQTLSDCGRLYLYFKNCLGKQFTEPKDAPDLPEFRLVDMWHSCTNPDVQANIVQQFCKKSHLRIIIATVAFGMGIYCVLNLEGKQSPTLQPGCRLIPGLWQL